MEQSKACTKCGQIKPISEFHFKIKSKNKRMSACIECLCNYQKNYRATHETKKYPNKQTNWDRSPRICEVCSATYIPNTYWQKTCGPKCSARLQNNKKVIPVNTGMCARCGKSLINKRANAIYCSRTCLSMDHNFKQRGNKEGRRVTTARRRLIMERDNFTCYLCFQVIDKSNVEIDHLVPRSRGGSSAPSNLSVTCLPCNRSRSNRIGIEQLNRLYELRPLID